MNIVATLNRVFYNFIPASALGSFILMIIACNMNRSYFKVFFGKIDKKTWMIAALIFLLALVLRMVIPLRGHILYLDEAWYMEAAKNMLQTGSQGHYPKPIGWPFLLAVSFAVFGVNNLVAIYTSIFIGALTTVGIFLMAFIITQRKDMGLIAALLFSFFPAHIRWSASAETNVASLFFTVLTVFFFFLYYRAPKRSLLWLALSALAFTVQIRSENYMLPVLFLAGCFIFGCRPFKKADLTLILVSVLLFMPNLIQTFVFYMHENWPHNIGLTAAGGSLPNLFYNFLHFARYIINAEFQPVLLSFLIVLGTGYMFFKQKKEWVFLLFWFVLLCFFYFFLASFQAIGAGSEPVLQTRFFMMFYPITLLFACYGILLVQRAFKNYEIKRYVLGSLIVVLILFFIPYVRQASGWFNDPIRSLDIKIPSLIKKDIPGDCVIISNWPVLLRATTDYRVMDIQEFLEDESEQEAILRSNTCILFYENCASFFPGFVLEKELCWRMEKRFLLEPFVSYQEKTAEFTFYKIIGPAEQGKGGRKEDRGRG